LNPHLPLYLELVLVLFQKPWGALEFDQRRWKS
jgi:hypothetical protein